MPNVTELQIPEYTLTFVHVLSVLDLTLQTEYQQIKKLNKDQKLATHTNTKLPLRSRKSHIYKSQIHIKCQKQRYVDKSAVSEKLFVVASNLCVL